MRVAIVTFHKAPSCGAQLQAWALRTVLEKLGHQVGFPSCNSIGAFPGRWPCRRPSDLSFLRYLRGQWKTLLENAGSIGVFRPAMARYDAFRARYLPECDVAADRLQEYFERIVYGSDQVWNPALTQADASLFLGETVADGAKKIAYAVSVGDGYPDDGNVRRIRTAAGNYAAVSVREPKVSELIRDVRGGDSPVVADPTLLLTEDDYRILHTAVRTPSDYIYYYSLYHHRDVYEKVRLLAKSLGIGLVYTPLYQYTRRGMPHGTVFGVSPNDFVTYMAHARAVVTDSFHGMVFALQHRKPFLVYRLTADSHETRPGALLKRLGLDERQVPWSVPVSQALELLQKPLPGEAYVRLAAFRRDSSAWLEGAVES